MENLSNQMLNGPRQELRQMRGMATHGKDLQDMAASARMESAAEEARAAAGIMTSAWRTALKWVTVVIVLAVIVAAWVLTNK